MRNNTLNDVDNKPLIQMKSMPDLQMGKENDANDKGIKTDSRITKRSNSIREENQVRKRDTILRKSQDKSQIKDNVWTHENVTDMIPGKPSTGVIQAPVRRERGKRTARALDTKPTLGHPVIRKEP